jgi:hypothetical protein
MKMSLEAGIDHVLRSTWRLRSAELRDALGGRDQSSLKMHLESERLSELRDALGCRDCASLEMHLEAAIK